MRQRTAETVGNGDAVTVAARVPARVSQRLDSIAERSGLTRAEVIRLALELFDGSTIPPGLIEAAQTLRLARGTV